MEFILQAKSGIFSHYFLMQRSLKYDDPLARDHLAKIQWQLAIYFYVYVCVCMYCEKEKRQHAVSKNLNNWL